MNIDIERVKQSKTWEMLDAGSLVGMWTEAGEIKGDDGVIATLGMGVAGELYIFTQEQHPDDTTHKIILRCSLSKVYRQAMESFFNE